MFRWTFGGLTSAMDAARRRKAGSAIPDSVVEGDAASHGLVAALRAALAPVPPRPAFRTELGRELAAVARQRRSPRVVLQRPRDYRRGLLIGAAAVSSAVSVAGLVALLWRHRAQLPRAAQG